MLYYLMCLTMGSALCAYCIRWALESEAQVKREMLLRDQLHRATANYVVAVAGKYSVLRKLDVLQQQVDAMNAQLEAQREAQPKAQEERQADMQKLD